MSHDTQITYRGIVAPADIVSNWSTERGSDWRTGVDLALGHKHADIDTSGRDSITHAEVFDRTFLDAYEDSHWLKRVSDGKWFFYNNHEIRPSKKPDDVKSFGIQLYSSSLFGDQNKTKSFEVWIPKPGYGGSIRQYFRPKDGGEIYFENSAGALTISSFRTRQDLIDAHFLPTFDDIELTTAQLNDAQ